jgi:hypothetical protein
MTLQNMRENGVLSLQVQCHLCRREIVMNVDHLPGNLTVPSFEPKMVIGAIIDRFGIDGSAS